jgi:predicted transposase YbfD/YdcC
LITDAIDDIVGKSDWKGLKTVGVMESTRKMEGKTSVEYRFYISSIEKDAARFAKAVRSHWGIETQLHWVLDVAFDEDHSRVRKDNAPENLARIRHIDLNLIKQEKTSKIGVKNRRLQAGWDEKYLEKVLQID